MVDVVAGGCSAHTAEVVAASCILCTWCFIDFLHVVAAEVSPVYLH